MRRAPGIIKELILDRPPFKALKHNAFKCRLRRNDPQPQGTANGAGCT